MGTFLAGERGVAQDLHLTVRPREIATGTRTEQAGSVQLENGKAYIPQQCVGTRRCPLVIYSNSSEELLIQVADKYGLILASGFWPIHHRMLVAVRDSVGDVRNRALDSVAANVASLDRLLKEILRRFAIDPDKIVLMGGSITGPPTAAYADQNLNVFSRIMLYTQQPGDPPVKSPGQTNEYYISGGLLENVAVFPYIRRLRDRGYPVKYHLQLRDHEHQYENYQSMGQWLQESWAIPDLAARPAPFAFGDPPLLTAQAMTQMTDFWTRFMNEPDSIRVTARRAYVREVVVPIGLEQVSTLMADMPAFAARYPSVAAAFKAAGLTPRQHDVYRAALISAHIIGVNQSPENVPPVSATSAIAKNVAFIHEHPDEYGALSKTGMWRAP